MLHPRVERILFGLQAGVLGGLATLGFLFLTSVIDRIPWWSYLNLLGTMFYGGRALHWGVGWPTIAGAACHLLFTGVAGATFGWTFGGIRGVLRKTLLGVIWALFWFYISQVFYRRSSPLIAVYMPVNATMAAHVLLGICLGRMPQPGRQLAAVNDEDDRNADEPVKREEESKIMAEDPAAPKESAPDAAQSTHDSDVIAQGEKRTSTQGAENTGAFS